MRRWFILLLLTLLPLQFATAAAASYCRHEAGMAKHFGHHEHQHGGQAATGEDQGAPASAGEGSHDNGTTLGGDSDCEYCHLGAAHPLLQDCSQPAGTPDAVPRGRQPMSFGSHDPGALDRPNWASLA